MPKKEIKVFLTAPTNRSVKITASVTGAADARITLFYKNWVKPGEDAVPVKEVEKLEHEILLDELGFHDLIVAGIRASSEEDAKMTVALNLTDPDEVLMAKRSVPFDGPAAVIRFNILTYTSS